MHTGVVDARDAHAVAIDVGFETLCGGEFSEAADISPVGHDRY
jgi:hypothetical protein